MDRLLNLLRSGHLHEGSKLPPERELCEQLGVSRTIVREALSALRLAGLIERRPGVGTVISRIPPITAGLDTYLEASVSISQLTEARLAVELGVVHLLCQASDPANLSDVQALIDVMKVAVVQESKPDNYIVPSLEFHLGLARATGSPVLARVQEYLTERMRPHLWLMAERYDLPQAEKSLTVHELIFGATKARDLVMALAAVKSHYMPYPGDGMIAATMLSLAGEGIDLGASPGEGQRE